MLFRQLFDRERPTYSYLVADEQRRVTRIDPVLEQVERDVAQLSGLTRSTTDKRLP